MSVEKAKLKMLFAADMGNRFDDMLEQANHAVAEAKGEEKAYLFGSSRIDEVMRVADKDEEEEKITAEERQIAKRWLFKAGGALRNLALGAGITRQRAEGRVATLRQVVAEMKKVHDAEEAKLKLLEQPSDSLVTGVGKRPEGGAPARRPVGTHPGPPLKAQRATKLTALSGGKAPKKRASKKRQVENGQQKSDEAGGSGVDSPEKVLNGSKGAPDGKNT